MVCCSAPSCSNRTKNCRLFRFPTDPARRKVWVLNCRRDKWKPTAGARLCQAHFTEDQFEAHRQDGRKLLKKSAIPTVFSFPCSPGTPKSKRVPPKKRVLEQVAVAVNIDNTCDNVTLDDSVEDLPEPDQEILELKKEIRRLKAQVLQLKKEKDELVQRLGGLFEPDQIQRLTYKGPSNPYMWTEKTIKKAFRIRAAVGHRGYEFLREIDLPLPSYRTLCRRIEATTFAPGIQEDIIHWLGVKLCRENDMAKKCILCIDEMQIRPTLEFDKGLKRYVGMISPEVLRKGEDPGKLATHALAFVVRGLALHWKQVVAYVLTGDSIEAPLLWGVLKNIMGRLSAAGFSVICISSDMGSNNTRLWGHLGIHSTRFQVTERIPHPTSDGWLYFMPDIPHILKNIRNCLMNNTIILPPSVVTQQGLPCDIVRLSHVKELIMLQEERRLKLAPKLTVEHVQPSQFLKMRVSHACELLSRTTACALQFCASVGMLSPAVKTTAFFLEQVNGWFDLMNARVQDYAVDKSEDKVKKLEDFVALMRNIKFGGCTKWKPIQTGVQLATRTILSLRNDLVVNGDQEYILTSRFTTDPVENLFSQIRGQGDIHPTPVKFRHSLKLISVSQYLSVPRYSSYDEDEDEYYLDFLKRKPELVEEEICEVHDWDPDEGFDIMEDCALYHVAGWAVHGVTKDLCCDSCTKLIRSDLPLENLPHQWTSSIERTNLCHPTELAFGLVKGAENFFRRHEKAIITNKCPHKFLMDNVMGEVDDGMKENLPKCHSILSLLLQKFFRLRVHILGEDVTKQRKAQTCYGSRSAFMHSVSRP